MLRPQGVEVSLDFDKTFHIFGFGDYAVVSPRTRHLHLDTFSIGRGEAELPPDISFVRGEGRCKADIIGTGSVSLYLFSSQLIQVFRAENVTGWYSTPVRFDDETASYGEYQALSVVGRCGAIDFARSRLVEKRKADRKEKWWRGLYFDPESWDGSDIFTPAGTAHVFMVARVAELLRLCDIDGATLVALSAVERIFVPPAQARR